jgi:hypothetical protein
MKAQLILAGFPLAAFVAALLFFLAAWLKRLHWVALGWLLISLPALAFITYRLWDHYVGPDTFAFWRLSLTHSNLSVLLPFAVISPLLLLASESKGLSKGRDGITSAFCCLALAAAFIAVLCDHFFLLTAALAVTTLCMAGSLALKRSDGWHPAGLIPAALSDLCFISGVLFIYLVNTGRGLFFPAVALNANGRLAAACGLLLAAALLRLASFPFHRWISVAAKGGKEVRFAHVLIDLVLGAYLLYLVTQVFFKFSGPWPWICLGAGAASLAAALRALLASTGGLETWGLLCAAAGGHIIISASPANQMSGVAVRFGAFAAVSMLALVSLGSESRWSEGMGGMALRGLPPLAGFAWRWMEFQALILAFTQGSRLLFAAVLPLVFAGALIEGFSGLSINAKEMENKSIYLPIASGALLTIFLLALGLYPGSFVDLVMREYGLAVNLPFAGWTSLGWAVLISILLLIIAMSFLRKREEGPREILPVRLLPIITLEGRLVLPGFEVLKKEGLILTALGLLFASWAGIFVFLAYR